MSHQSKKSVKTRKKYATNHHCPKEISSDELQTNLQVATFAADSDIQVMIWIM